VEELAWGQTRPTLAATFTETFLVHSWYNGRVDEI
jgi:hypothetical protein